MDRTPAYVVDMMEAARELIELAAGLALPQFVADRIRCLAAEKLFINLGEAASRIPVQEQPGIPGVPWPQVIATRNILAHRYEQIDHQVLYQTITSDLPVVLAALEEWLAKQPRP